MPYLSVSLVYQPGTSVDEQLVPLPGDIFHLKIPEESFVLSVPVKANSVSGKSISLVPIIQLSIVEYLQLFCKSELWMLNS